MGPTLGEKSAMENTHAKKKPAREPSPSATEHVQFHPPALRLRVSNGHRLGMDVVTRFAASTLLRLDFETTVVQRGRERPSPRWSRTQLCVFLNFDVCDV